MDEAPRLHWALHRAVRLGGPFFCGPDSSLQTALGTRFSGLRRMPISQRRPQCNAGLPSPEHRAMPMLALLLLMAGLCNRDGGTGSDSLRMQILQADAQRAVRAPATYGQTDSQSVQILRLSADRVLQVAHARVHGDADGIQRGQSHALGMLQLWQRVDGHWQLQRSASVEQRG